MRTAKWTVVAKTTPMDAQAAQEQARWLKLGDDALLNRTNNTDESVLGNLLRPGVRALGQFEAIARELQRTVRKYRKRLRHPAGQSM